MYGLSLHLHDVRIVIVLHEITFIFGKGYRGKMHDYVIVRMRHGRLRHLQIEIHFSVRDRIGINSVAENIWYWMISFFFVLGSKEINFAHTYKQSAKNGVHDWCISIL